MPNPEKVIRIEKQVVEMTAQQFMQSYLLNCKFPNGNELLTIRKSSKQDKDAIAFAKAFGVETFTIPKD